MGIIAGSVLFPHPPLLVPDIGGRDVETVAATQQSVRQACQYVKSLDPDCLIVITPHGVVLRDSVTMLMLPKVSGDFGQFGCSQVKLQFDCDLELAKQIYHQCVKHEGQLTMITDEIVQSRPDVGQVDHGALVPLYYLREAGVNVPIVHLSIGMLSAQQLLDFGKSVRQAVQATDTRAVVVTSGDLSHRLLDSGPYGYHPDGPLFDHQLTQLLQQMNVRQLLDMDEQLVENAGQCGLRPLYLMLGVLDGLRVEAQLLSYEGPFGVGYAVMTFAVASAAQHAQTQSLDQSQPERSIVQLARRSMEHFLATGQYLQEPQGLPAALQQPSAAFVSLKKFGALRGCIGTFLPTQDTLAQEIIHNAVSAATQDPRFKPVTADELADIDISVDVLSEPQPIRSKQELDPKRYGVIVHCGYRSGLLLPDLEGVDTVDEQLSIAMQKAGIAPEEPVQVSRFTVTRYKQ